MLNAPQANTFSISSVHRSINQKYNIHVHKSFRMKTKHSSENIFIAKSFVFKYTTALRKKESSEKMCK